MSNNYNSTLQSNNVDLQTILNIVNSLPNAGSGENGGTDVSGVTASASDVLVGKKYVTADGKLVNGTMPNNGTVSKTMDGLNTKSVSIPAGYTSGGTVSLTNDIDNIADTQSNKIAQIKTALESKAAGGGGGGAVDTCSVTIVKNLPGSHSIIYKTPDDAIVTQYYSYGASVVLSDVVCDSLLVIHGTTHIIVPAASVSGEGSLVVSDPFSFTFLTPATSGAETTFTVRDAD